jgi:type I restriction enzyme S subunit
MRVRETAELSQVCKIIGGGTPSKKNEAFYKGEIPWATVRDMNCDVISETQFKITREAVNASSTNIIPCGNVVIASRVGLGKSCVLGQDTAINQDLKALLPNDPDSLDKRYLFHWCRQTAPLLIGAGQGATVQGVTVKFLSEMQIPLPPLPEQKRIVAILDEAFGAIAKAKENAERNLANARELFESYLNRVFTEKGEGWEERLFGDESLITIIDGDRGVNYPKKKDFADTGFCLFMNTKNVRPDGLNFDSSSFITKEKDEALRKGKLQRNDVVITTRGTVGNLGVYSDDVPYEHLRINSGMLILRPNPKDLDSWYLFTVLRSGYFRSQMQRSITGAAQPQLPIKTLVNLKIATPVSLAVQKEIVDEARRVSGHSNVLRLTYQSRIAALNELKQSILQKAFTGQLTAKSPELEAVP